MPNDNNPYETLIAAARIAITEDIRKNPEDWKREDQLTDFLIDTVQEAVVPDSADFAWAVKVIEAKPSILKRKIDEPADSAWFAICEAIGEQVIADIRREFEPVTDRLIVEDWEDRAPSERSM